VKVNSVAKTPCASNTESVIEVDVDTLATMATMLMTGLAVVTYLNRSILGLRTEVKREMGSLRTELKTDIADLRTELKTDIADLRQDLRILDQRVYDLTVTVHADRMPPMQQVKTS
jgi:phage host-nuclease inhibitor protein Gam